MAHPAFILSGATATSPLSVGNWQVPRFLICGAVMLEPAYFLCSWWWVCLLGKFALWSMAKTWLAARSQRVAIEEVRISCSMNVGTVCYFAVTSVFTEDVAKWRGVVKNVASAETRDDNERQSG